MFFYSYTIGLCLIALGAGILCALFLPVWCILVVVSMVLICAGVLFLNR